MFCKPNVLLKCLCVACLFYCKIYELNVCTNNMLLICQQSEIGVFDKRLTLVEKVKQFFGFSPQQSENERKKPLTNETDKKENEKEKSVNFFNNIIQFLMKSKLFSVSFANFLIKKDKITNLKMFMLA